MWDAFTAHPYLSMAILVGVLLMIDRYYGWPVCKILGEIACEID